LRREFDQTDIDCFFRYAASSFFYWPVSLLTVLLHSRLQEIFWGVSWLRVTLLAQGVVSYLNDVHFYGTERLVVFLTAT